MCVCVCVYVCVCVCVQAREEQVLSTRLQIEQMESVERRKRAAEADDEINKSRKKAKEFLIDQLVRMDV